MGDDSSIWELLSDEEAKAALVVHLKGMFPDIADRITMPTSFFMTRHGADPLTRGAYVETCFAKSPQRCDVVCEKVCLRCVVCDL